MRNVILVILTLLTVNCFGQKWTEHKFDDNLTVNLPEDFQIVDTLDQHIVKAQIANAMIMVQRLPNKGETATDISDKEKLIEVYEGFQEGVVGSHNGQLIKQQFEERDGLQVTRFSYRAALGEEQHIRHCFTVFLNENWYTIHFWEIAELTNELQNDRDRLFSSLKFPVGQSLKNQLSSSTENSSAYLQGVLMGKMVVFAGGVIAIVMLIRKRRKKKEPADREKPIV